MSYFTDPYSGKKKFYKGGGRNSERKFNDDPLPKDPVKREKVLQSWKKIGDKKLDNLPVIQTEKEKKQEILKQRQEIDRIRRLERLAIRKKKK